jgi:hypothetical protein
MMALARAAEVAIMSGDGSAAAPVARLLRLQRDRGVTYWADEALAVAALLLADRLPEEAAVILNASHGLQDALNDTGSQLGAMRGRLRQCRHGLVESLGQQRWDDAEQRGRTMSTGTAIVSALAALESFSSGG